METINEEESTITTIKLNNDLLKKVRIFCIKNEITMIEFFENLAKEKLENEAKNG